MRTGIIIIIVGLIVGVAPLGLAWLAETIANANGCQLDVGGIYPCEIGGRDYGEPLAHMFFMGFYLIVSIPAGAVIAILGGLWFIIAGVRRLFFRRDDRIAEG